MTFKVSFVTQNVLTSWPHLVYLVFLAACIAAVKLVITFTVATYQSFLPRVGRGTDHCSQRSIWQLFTWGGYRHTRPWLASRDSSTVCSLWNLMYFPLLLTYPVYLTKNLEVRYCFYKCSTLYPRGPCLVLCYSTTQQAKPHHNIGLNTKLYC